MVALLLPLASLAATDWLVEPVKRPAAVEPTESKTGLRLDNSLISRVVVLAPNAASIDYRNRVTGAGILRGVKPEAVVNLDGQRIEVGGLRGQPDYAYFDPAWLADMTSNPDAFQYVDYTVSKPEARYAWTPKRHAPDTPWPPKGVTLNLRFKAPDALQSKYGGVEIFVHYELYDGLPVMAKWVTVANNGAGAIGIDGLENEILAVNEQEKERLHVESNYVFNTMVTTSWGPDPDYKTQVNYEYLSPVLMTSRYPMGPGVKLKPGERFDSFRTYTVLFDSDDRERRGLTLRRIMRTLAPQVTENPIFMHVRSSDSAAVRLAVDQCADVGFEMIIMTFGSGFDIESEDPAYLANVKADVAYAHAKGIEVGGYTLMTASRDIGPEFNCISPDTGKPGSMFGQSVCLASEWSDGYFRRVLHLMGETGMDMIETDGPFHGDKCASTTHAHHLGLADSQYRQWERCCSFYQECRKRGIFINTPDWYYMNGSNKCAMGYRETNFSLPRWRQVLISRQNIYDGTFEKTPSMGWMFVPLVEYQGGGAAATMEPLAEHLAEYEWHLAQNFGCGVQACYRGPRLYDSDATRAVVKKWVDFYKQHRDILDSDIIHVRRADGQGIDCMMHVNPALEEKALVMVFNPTDAEQKTTLTLPLYYTGLTEKAEIREKDDAPEVYELDREFRVDVPVTMEPKEITWLLVE